MAAGQVRHDEKQIADLLALLLGCSGRVQLGQLLVDLVDDADDVGPVVPEVGGALLHLLGRGEGGHGPGDAVQSASNLRRFDGLVARLAGCLFALGSL